MTLSPKTMTSNSPWPWRRVKILRLGRLRALTSSAQTPILPISGVLAVAASAEDVVGLTRTDVLSGSLPAALVEVDPLKRRRVAETDRLGRGALSGKAGSLFVVKLMELLRLFDDDFALVASSLEVSAGGETRVAAEMKLMGAVVTSVLSVAVVGGPKAGPVGILRGLRGSSKINPWADSLELDTTGVPLAVASDIADRVACNGLGDGW
jgi:hypothetical protein